MDKILEDPHFKVVRYFQKTSDVFPSVDIKGGVVSIMEKIKGLSNLSEANMSDLVSSQGIYKFSDKAFNDYPQILEIQGKGTAAKITSKVFENIQSLFCSKQTNDGAEYIKIFGLCKGKREYRWIKKEYVQPNDYLMTYNVFVPEANGTGAIGEVLSTPVIGVPVIGHTDTFLSIGKFADAQEASACLNYVKTKFARCLLGTLKATQHNPRDTWANVPLQDFTSHSDINWSASVADIDQQLYRKYGLSADEIAFIEKMIKPME